MFIYACVLFNMLFQLQTASQGKPWGSQYFICWSEHMKMFKNIFILMKYNIRGFSHEMLNYLTTYLDTIKYFGMSKNHNNYLVYSLF